MPNFNLQPLDEQELNSLQPVARGGAEMRTAARAGNAEKLESMASKIPWVGKPAAQLFNALGSLDASNPANFVAGPINGISKLGNAVGDWVQGKDVDTGDAWQIPDEFTRRFDMRRYSGSGDKGFSGLEYESGVTPADEAGRGIAEGLGGEIAGAAATGGLSLLAQPLGITRRLMQSNQIRQAVMAANRTQTGRRLLSAGNYGAEAVTSTALASLFMDNSEGNLGNITQLFDPNAKPLPFGVEEDDDYLEATGKTIFGEGILAPLAIFGVAMPVAPFRRAILDGNMPRAAQEIINSELAPYGAVAPQNRLPGMQGPQEPGGALAVAPTPEPGGAIVPYDSAISRGIDENLQVQQVVQQRQRLENMGLVETGRGNQLQLTMPGVVDPEVKLQIRQLQTERGVLIKDGADDAALAQIDQQIDDLTMQGSSNADRIPPQQGELDMPDGRPELDTYLAMMDEMGDEQLARMLENINGPLKTKQRQGKIEAQQQRIQDLEQEILNIQQRLGPDAKKPLTATGAKRKVNKVEVELTAARTELDRLQADATESKSTTVGQQLDINMQGQLDFSPQAMAADVELPPIKDFEFVELPDGTGMWRPKGEEKVTGGYGSAAAYREDLMGWNRDLLRKMANPTNSPELAALIKARTGRRVYGAKKVDIVNAFVELAEKRGRFAAPAAVFEQVELNVPQQGDLALFDTTVGGEYSMLPKTAMNRASRREAIKKELLQAAINNGEVQAPVTPLPKRPTVDYDQTSLINDLMSDENGQFALAYATDALPTYRAGNKSVEAMLEEIRLRLDFGKLDGDALRMQRQAVLDSLNWDQLTWAQKQQTGLIDTSKYSYQGQALQYGREQLGFKRQSEVNWVKGGAEQEAAALLEANRPNVIKPSTKKSAKAKQETATPPKQPQTYKFAKGEVVAEGAIAPPRAEVKSSLEAPPGYSDRFEDLPPRLQKRKLNQFMDGKRVNMDGNKQRLAMIEAEQAQLQAQQLGRSC